MTPSIRTSSHHSWKTITSVLRILSLISSHDHIPNRLSSPLAIMSDPCHRSLSPYSEEVLNEYSTAFPDESSAGRVGMRAIPRGAMNNYSYDETSFWDVFHIPIYLDSLEALRYVGLRKYESPPQNRSSETSAAVQNARFLRCQQRFTSYSAL